MRRLKFLWQNTHLDHKGQQAREHGVAMIFQASGVLPKDFPQILSGDMNAGPNNPAIKNYKDAGWVETDFALASFPRLAQIFIWN